VALESALRGRVERRDGVLLEMASNGARGVVSDRGSVDEGRGHESKTNDKCGAACVHGPPRFGAETGFELSLIRAHAET
jgi:hypothetical protein